MSYLLTEPTTVLVVGESEAAVEHVRGVVTGGTATEVLAAPSLRRAREVLEDRDDVGCVVVAGADDVDPVAVADGVDGTGARLPVVVHAQASAVDLAALAGRRDCQFVPASADDATLRETVDDALARFDERRREIAESELFTTLLEDGELSVFAKDDRARHVYKADLEDDEGPESFLGRTDVEVMSDGVADRARESYEDDLEVVETGEPIYGKVTHYRFGDHDHWSEVTKVPWERDGETVGLVGVSQDVTQRKLAERRLREQAETVDQFVSYVSHDLRTPLQVAYGSLELAREGDEAALDRIENAVERIDDIVDDLSRLVRSKGSTDVSGALQSLRAESLTTELVPLGEEVWSVIAPDRAELVVELPAETVVGAEAEALRPILENLLKNAVDHAGPDVTVRIGEAGDSGFFVADDGPGIPEDERSRVTEAGYTTSAEGSGTGLDIVAESVDQQGWELTVTESRTGGARFEITDVPTVTDPDVDARPADRIELDGSTDVGPVSIPGSAEYDPDADAWTVVADGTNVWRDTHEFHCVHGSGTAPVRVQGRIDELDGVEEYSKAGVAVRAGLDERAPFGYVGQTESHGSELTWRPSADGFTDSDQFEEVPGTFPWYRVDYVDGVVTCSLSKDGDEWLPVDQRPVDLGEEVSVGLMACSHSGKNTVEVTFSDVRAWELEVE